MTASPITFTEAESKNYEGGTAGTQGTPHAVEYWWSDANNLSVQTCTFKQVPSGAYNLFLYGKNGNQNYADRGSIFAVSVGGTSYGSKGTVNSITSSFTLVMSMWNSPAPVGQFEHDSQLGGPEHQ